MRAMKIKELMTLTPGINPSREGKALKVDEINYYDRSSFESDYNQDDSLMVNSLLTSSENQFALRQGDIVINNSLSLAAIVGQNNAGKVLSLNFTKAEFNNDLLDSRFFLYLLNENKNVKRQKERELRGTGAIQRIPIRALGQIVIPIIPLPEQQKIGKIYTETLKLRGKLSKYGNLLEQFTSLILEECMKEN